MDLHGMIFPEVRNDAAPFRDFHGASAKALPRAGSPAAMVEVSAFEKQARFVTNLKPLKRQHAGGQPSVQYRGRVVADGGDTKVLTQ